MPILGDRHSHSVNQWGFTGIRRDDSDDSDDSDDLVTPSCLDTRHLAPKLLSITSRTTFLPGYILLQLA